MKEQRLNIVLDNKLHKEFKRIVLDNDTSMRKELIKMIEEYVRNNKK